MRIGSAVRDGALATLVCVGALVATAGTANAAASLTVSSGEVLAKGAAVTASLSVSCDPLPPPPPGFPGANSIFLSVQISQAVDGGVTEGTGSASDVICDGTVHPVDVFVIPTLGGHMTLPFAKGQAFVLARLQACSLPNGCQSASEGTTVDLD